MRFNTGKLEFVAKVGPAPTDQEIEDENMLFQYRAEDVPLLFKNALSMRCMRVLRESSGLTANQFWGLRVDTRSQLLGQGDMASRGGWHCDFMSEQNYATIEPTDRDAGVRHFMCVSGPPMTQFLPERGIELNLPRAFAWADVDAKLGRPANAFPLQPMCLYEFDAYELHRAVPHESPDLTWRWFFRASYFPAGTKYANKIRRQVQVYR